MYLILLVIVLQKKKKKSIKNLNPTNQRSVFELWIDFLKNDLNVTKKCFNVDSSFKRRKYSCADRYINDKFWQQQSSNRRQQPVKKVLLLISGALDPSATRRCLEKLEYSFRKYFTPFWMGSVELVMGELTWHLKLWDLRLKLRRSLVKTLRLLFDSTA